MAPPQQQSPPKQSVPRKPGLTRDEVLQRFRERATPDQLREFEQLQVASDEASGMRSLELVLFTLTRDELFKIGITQDRSSGWAVASCRQTPSVMQVVLKALEPEQISVMASCDLVTADCMCHASSSSGAQSIDRHHQSQILWESALWTRCSVSNECAEQAGCTEPRDCVRLDCGHPRRGSVSRDVDMAASHDMRILTLMLTVNSLEHCHWLPPRSSGVP
jgi:hypothetical protein